MNGTSIDYDTFNALYKSSELIKNVVKNYNDEGIEFDNGSDLPATKKSGNTVKSMAKRATDLTDL